MHKYMCTHIDRNKDKAPTLYMLIISSTEPPISVKMLIWTNKPSWRDKANGDTVKKTLNLFSQIRLVIIYMHSKKKSKRTKYYFLSRLVVSRMNID